MSHDTKKNVALIVAAGRGTRAPGAIPKQYRYVGGVPVIAHATRAFLHHPKIDGVQVVIHPDDMALYELSVVPHEKILPPVIGGASRAESVMNGLQTLKALGTQGVLIHDAARPFVSADVISHVINGVTAQQGAIPTLPAVDSMRLSQDGLLGASVARDGVARAQTPQGFMLGDLMPLFEQAQQNGTLPALSDEGEAAIAAGMRVLSVGGDPMNFKLTIPEDFMMAERVLSMPDIRVGQGYDVHAFGEGDQVTLCGVSVPHGRGLKGHSDADVGLHTITDALLGALAEGDIGRHFPPSDPQWKGTDSAVFLKRAVEIVAERGYAISNIDATLICEEPKIGPHANAMRERVAAICGINVGRVSIKATTTEQLGFCGRREGIAAMAVATVIGTEVGPTA